MLTIQNSLSSDCLAHKLINAFFDDASKNEDHFH